MNLYKYLSVDVGLTVLQTGLIRFTQPQVFNDPFELKPAIVGFCQSDFLDASIQKNLPKVLESEYESLPFFIKRALSFDQFKQLVTMRFPDIQTGVNTGTQLMTPTLRRGLEEKLESFIGILCLSQSDDNLTMWAHYAEQHQGIAIGFDSSHSYFQNLDGSNGTPAHLRQVKYFAERPQLTFSGLSSDNLFSTKGDDWEAEKEWRIFAQLDKAQTTVTNIKGDQVHLYSYPRESIAEIILGCRATQKTCDEIINLTSSISSLSQAKVYSSHIDQKAYRLNFEEIMTSQGREGKSGTNPT